jgi:uncharacterized protein with gpF-like domain
MSIDLPLRLPFREQLRFLRGKINKPTKSWRDVMRDEHDHAFMVAGAMKADLLQDLRNAVEQAIAEGKGLEWFQKNFEEIVSKHGWVHYGTPSWRARVIWETNYLTSYSAGRYAQMTEPSFLKAMPYWMWRHGDSVHPRPQHLAWDGMVLAASDTFWSDHYPPCGWGCKCTVFAMDANDLAEKGLKVLDKAPNPLMPTRPGEAMPGVDIGFDYTPGKTSVERMRPVIKEKMRGYSKPISDSLRKEIQAYLAED